MLARELLRAKRIRQLMMDCGPQEASADDHQPRDQLRKPYYLSVLASAFAPRISARNGWAAAGTGTSPNSKARVVTSP